MVTLARKLMDAPASGAGPVVIERTADPAGVAHSSDVVTYSSQSIGSATSDRIIVVTVLSEKSTAAPVSATINSGGGPVSMNSTATGNFGITYSKIFYLAVSTGTTATIAVTFTGGSSVGSSQNKIVVYKVTGADATPATSGTDGSTDMDATDPLTTGSISIPTDGGFIGAVCSATQTTTHTWTNATEDLDASGGNFRYSTATRTTPGTVTITCEAVAGNEDGALSFIVFDPA